MKKLGRQFQNLRLNQRFVLVILCVLVVPIIILAGVLLENTRRVLVEEKIYEVQRGIEQIRSNIEKTVDMCNIVTQVFLGSAVLHDNLAGAAQSIALSPEALLHFKATEIASYENLVNANPSLDQVRVFTTSDVMPEIMPVLYGQDRMERLAWAQGPWESGSWQLDYHDALFPESIRPGQAHMMGLVTSIDDYDLGRIGVLEVLVRMEDLMPAVFDAGGNTWAAFITETGNIAYAPEAQRLLAEIEADGYLAGSSDAQTVQMNLDGGPALVSTLPLRALRGTYVQVTSLADIMQQIGAQQSAFVTITLLLIVLLGVIVNLVVKVMLRRFYVVLRAISQVQAGDFSATVPDMGRDEFGQLGRQFNIMLERIVQLMQENVNRQLLAKNSEIRALQNQINAHFIYNVLESIKMMAEMDEKYEMADAITALGKLLRYSMRWTSGNVSIAQELEYIQNYLALLNLRYDYRISLRLDLPAHILMQEVPKMSLQPIVENAVIHGIEALAEDAYIDIGAVEEDGFFTIHISDYGKGMDAEQLAVLVKKVQGEIEDGAGSGNGIGLKNVQDRIHIAFGPAYGLSLASKVGCYTRVMVKLPYSKAAERGTPKP